MKFDVHLLGTIGKYSTKFEADMFRIVARKVVHRWWQCWKKWQWQQQQWSKTIYIYTGLLCQSRISPRRGRQLPRGGRQHMILPKFPKNCTKLKEFGPLGARVPCAPPLRSATDVFDFHHQPKNAIRNYPSKYSSFQFLLPALNSGSVFQV